jgi:hypothetical protein
MEWWKNLDPKQRTLIALGVPAVAVAAIVSNMRRKTGATAAPAGPTTTTVMTGPPVFGTGGTELYELYRQLTDWLTDYAQTQLPPSANDPCQPGAAWDPKRCTSAQLVSACVSTGGAEAILAELWRRGHSINDPNFGGPGSPNACGRAAVTYWLSHGAVPA